jgi:hypothetical protein
MKLHIAVWFDIEDRIFRVAGVYFFRRSAEKRLEQVGNGAIQTVTLGKAIRFTHEAQ